MNAPVGSTVGKCHGLICSRRKRLGKVPLLGRAGGTPAAAAPGDSQGKGHLPLLCPHSCCLGGCSLCGAGLPAFSLCWVLQWDAGGRAGCWGNGVVCGFERRSRERLCSFPRAGAAPSGSAAGREWGWCLSQTCKRIRGFQMQISRLGCRRLRDRDGVAPRGWAATCQGGPVPQGAQSRRLLARASRPSSRVLPAPGESSLCNIDSSLGINLETGIREAMAQLRLQPQSPGPSD